MNDPAMMAKIPLDRSHLQTMLFLQLAAGGTCSCSSYAAVAL
jgi:hypothetical protein